MSVVNKLMRDLDASRSYAPSVPRAVLFRTVSHGKIYTPTLPQLENPHQLYWSVALALIPIAAGMGYFASSYYVLQERQSPASLVRIVADPNITSVKNSSLPAAANANNAKPVVPANALPSTTTAMNKPVTVVAAVVGPLPAPTAMPVKAPVPASVALAVNVQKPAVPPAVIANAGAAPAAPAVPVTLPKPMVASAVTPPTQPAAAAVVLPKVVLAPNPQFVAPKPVITAAPAVVSKIEPAKAAVSPVPAGVVPVAVPAAAVKPAMQAPSANPSVKTPVPPAPVAQINRPVTAQEIIAQLKPLSTASVQTK